MTVRQYDRVRLSDGRTCTIVDILKAGYAYIADVDLPRSRLGNYRNPAE